MKTKIRRYGGLILIGYAAVRTGLLLSQDTGMRRAWTSHRILILAAVGLGLFAAAASVSEMLPF